MKRLEYEKNSPEGRATMKFMGIYGVGPATAREWYQRGLRTLEDVLDGKDGVTLSPAQHVSVFSLHFPIFDIDSTTKFAKSATAWVGVL